MKWIIIRNSVLKLSDSRAFKWRSSVDHVALFQKIGSTVKTDVRVF